MPKVLKSISHRAALCALAGFLTFVVGCASQQTPETSERPESAPPETVHKEAEQEAEQGLRVERVANRPFQPDTLYALLVAEIAGSRNRYDIAISNYVQQALATRDPAVTARAARIARLLSAHEAALEMAYLWLELEPDNPEAHFIAGAELTRTGQLAEAAHHSAVLLEQGEEGFFEAIAANAAQAGDDSLVKKLHEQYSTLLKEYPNSASLQLGQSLLLQYLGDLEAALTAARRAGDLEPDHYHASLQETRILQSMGKEEEAARGLANLVNRFPDNQRLRLQYARLLAQSDLDNAESQFKKLVEQSPGDPDFLFSLGLIQLEQGLVKQARNQFESLTQGEEHRDAAHYYLGQIAESQENLEEALQHYQQVEAGAEYLPAVMQSAQILLYQRGLQAALDYIRSERSVASGEDEDKLFLLEAELLEGADRPQQALQVLGEGLEKRPDSVRLLYARAMTYVDEDRVEAAEQDLKRILQSDPDNAATLNALGYVLADKTDRLQEAYDYISAALAIEPDDGAILDSMGWVQYRMGNHDEALTFLRQALEATPDAEIAAHLGEVLWVTGERREAKEVWRKGLDLSPDSRIIQETLDRLDAELEGR